MKLKRIFLCTLASISVALILPALSDDPSQKQGAAQVKVRLDPKIEVKYFEAVQVQVLKHLNPKVPISQRFSRVLRPMPRQYYDSEIARSGKGGIVEFYIMHNDRMDPEKPLRTRFASGKFNSRTGEVFLLDSARGKYVLAEEHPQIRKGVTS